MVNVVAQGNETSTLSNLGISDSFIFSFPNLFGGRFLDRVKDATNNIELGNKRDVIDSGLGQDTISAGDGQDVFVYGIESIGTITANPNDGVRQVTNVQDTLLDYNAREDIIALDQSDFGVTGRLVFTNTTAQQLQEGANVIILQDTDNDNNASTAFNAGAAASLIANNLETDGAGFFIYWNSDLGVNRLVYSTNLNDTAADLTILNRINSSEPAANSIAQLQEFTSDGFAFV